MAVLVLLYVALSCVVAVDSMICDYTTTMGTEFVFAIPKLYTSADMFVIHISTRQTAHVMVRVPNIRKLDKYTVNSFINVNISSSIEHSSSGKSDKAIIITSDEPCSVSVLPHDANDNVEGFMVLPVSALSTKYVVASYAPYSGNSEFLLVAMENGTLVTFTTYQNGQPSGHHIDLEQHGVFQYRSSKDLSNTVITSNKPIAVISGTESVKIPIGTGDYQFIVEQLVPTKYWGRTYIVPNLYPRDGYFVRMFSNETNVTALAYSGGTNANVIALTHRYAELHGTNSTPMVISSPEAISLMQYGDDSDGMAGDPFMTTVQAMSQYQSRYDFVTDFIPFSNLKWKVTLAVTARTSDINDILLDNKTYLTSAMKTQVPPPYDDYTVLSYNMTYDQFGMGHTLQHRYGHRFGAMLYSFEGTAVAYGYPLGFQLTADACYTTTTTSTSTSTTTTATTTTSTTTRITSTTARATPSTTSFTGKPDSNMRCFNCRDIPHLKYCDHLITCAANEMCYVEKYANLYGELLYRSGCMQREVCSPVQTDLECLHCCDNEDYCNSQGCGDMGIQGVLSRGPICYDCNHVGELDECNSIQVCGRDQVCMIEKNVWGLDDYNYAMGCVQRNACQETKRHVPVCSHCCGQDFCNNNCTHVVNSVLIG